MSGRQSAARGGTWEACGHWRVGHAPSVGTQFIFINHRMAHLLVSPSKRFNRKLNYLYHEDVDAASERQQAHSRRPGTQPHLLWMLKHRRRLKRLQDSASMLVSGVFSAVMVAENSRSKSASQ